MAEHHFQYEGYEVIPNLLMRRASVPSDDAAEDRLRFNIAPIGTRCAWRRITRSPIS